MVNACITATNSGWGEGGWGVGCCRICTFKANECCIKTAAIAQAGAPGITISMKVKRMVKFPDTRWHTFGPELRRKKKKGR